MDRNGGKYMSNKCPKCGREIEDNSSFCGYCGYKLVQDANRTAQKNNNLKQIGAIGIVILVVCLIFGGVFIHNRTSTTKKYESITEESLLESAGDEDYSLYYSLNKYKSFYKDNEEKSYNTELYDGKDIKNIKRDVNKVLYSPDDDIREAKVRKNIKLCKTDNAYFDTFICVDADEKNQKYSRGYFFRNDELVSSIVFDLDDTDDIYRYYYSDGVIYRYSTPTKTYKYSDMIPTKWGYFSYREASDLYDDYHNYTVSKYDEDYEYDDDDYDVDDSSDYIFPDSDSKYLTRSEVENLSQTDNRLAINEIYARHGYTYETEDLKEYFESKDWYESDPDINQSTWNDNMLNDYERANINLLATVAKEKGYR